MVSRVVEGDLLHTSKREFHVLERLRFWEVQLVRSLADTGIIEIIAGNCDVHRKGSVEVAGEFTLHMNDDSGGPGRRATEILELGPLFRDGL